MTQKLYAFTYKIDDVEDPSEYDYEARILGILRRKYDLIDHVYEHDSKGKLHVHGIVDFGFKVPRFTTMVPKGIHSNHKMIYDLDGWRRYLLKEQRSQIDNTQYMF